MALVNLPVERAPVVGGPSASGLDRDTTDKGGGNSFPPPFACPPLLPCYGVAGVVENLLDFGHRQLLRIIAEPHRLGRDIGIDRLDPMQSAQGPIDRADTVFAAHIGDGEHDLLRVCHESNSSLSLVCTTSFSLRPRNL